MIFAPVPIDQAEGLILGHNVVDRAGRRRLRKGSSLTAHDLEILEQTGHRSVWVAKPSPDDVDEDRAAQTVTQALLAPRTAAQLLIGISGPRTGRVNLNSIQSGVLRIDQDQVHSVNQWQGITFATREPFSVVDPGLTVATIKILPYALPSDLLAEATAALPQSPAVEVLLLRPRRVGLIVTGRKAGSERALSSFGTSLQSRVERLGSTLTTIEFIATDTNLGSVVALAEAIGKTADDLDLLLLAGETAIQDRHDIVPCAIERAGGTIICYGAPVDPGNLFLLGKLAGTAVVGVPGCARSPKHNIIDLVLPRLLVDEEITREDINRLGVGGLLDDVPERPLPRHRI